MAQSNPTMTQRTPANAGTATPVASQKIVPHLWFDKEAQEAAKFYTSIFPDARITHVTTLHDTPSGDADVVGLELAGHRFMAISAGPLFKFNPSISFHVKCATRQEVDSLWEKLVKGGQVLMELGEYPFSKRYGWLQDRYGLSWQLILAHEGQLGQRITPALLFVGDVCGRAEEAVNFYASVFPNSKAEVMSRYGKGEAPEKEGTVRYAHLVLAGQEFAVLDSAQEHKFSFNEAISLMVYCDDQKEIDHYWTKLSAVPEAEQCGWLKDKFGVSWQIVPRVMDTMMREGSPQQIARVTAAFLPMKKFNIRELERAYNA